jgi:hypothetical protein
MPTLNVLGASVVGAAVVGAAVVGAGVVPPHPAATKLVINRIANNNVNLLFILTLHLSFV